MINARMSVISVVYNLIEAGRKKTFEQMVNSVAGQTYPNLEHIIVDGASSDGTIDLIKSAARKHKTIRWISESDAGISEAMNKGAKLASGKYINFLSSDDFFHETAGIERSAKALEAQNADFSYATVRIMQNEKIKRNLTPKHQRFLHGIPFCHQSMFVKRDVIFELGGFDTSLKIVADFKMTINLFLKSYRGVCILDNFITSRTGGISSDWEQTSRELAILYRDTYFRFKNYTEEEWLQFARKKRLPLGLLWKILKSHDTNNMTKRSALYQMRRTIFRWLTGR